jgi:hypothetical protein
MTGIQDAAPAKRRPGAAAKPFSIRLTDDEKRHLLTRAGTKPLGAYIRGLILADGLQATRAPARRAPTPVKDHEALARVLAALGQSRISNNLNQLAKAVNIGVLPAAPETEMEIAGACSAVVRMRRDLMRALGLIEEERR